MKKILLAATLALLAGCVVPIPATVATGPVSSAPVQSTGSFTNDLNNFRSSQGLGPVKQSAILTRAAQLHAQDMVARGYFSHRAPGGPNGETLMARAASAGCATTFGAENIANGQTSEAAVLESWKNSAGHRANMLQPRFTDYGLGREGNIWVLMLSNGC